MNMDGLLELEFAQCARPNSGFSKKWCIAWRQDVSRQAMAVPMGLVTGVEGFE